jgi:hypothetical protein
MNPRAIPLLLAHPLLPAQIAPAWSPDIASTTDQIALPVTSEGKVKVPVRALLISMRSIVRCYGNSNALTEKVPLVLVLIANGSE